MARVPFKLRSSGPFKEMGSSPARQDDDKDKSELSVTPEEYQANVDSLQTFQHQNIGTGDPRYEQIGADMYFKKWLADEFGKEEADNYASPKRVHGDKEDWEEADARLEGSKISRKTYFRALNNYWNAKIKK
tara:strand:+ start:84 stop:479 length:396 start_codon:yes stop_codon:yes gene_type:complete